MELNDWEEEKVREGLKSEDSKHMVPCQALGFYFEGDEKTWEDFEQGSEILWHFQLWLWELIPEGKVEGGQGKSETWGSNYKWELFDVSEMGKLMLGRGSKD